MASDPKGKPRGNGLAPMSDYGQRAAVALDQLLPGEHRDKIVARMFSVSLRMAKYLRAGQHWTAARLSQASAVLGAAFDIALVSPDSHHNQEMGEIAGRLARLEEWRAQIDRGADARLAQTQGAAVEPLGGGYRFGESAGFGRESEPADGGGPTAQGHGQVVGGSAATARGRVTR